MKKISPFLMAVMMSIGIDRFEQTRIDELEDVDIKKEMDLIRQKKSNLSVRLRNIVEYRYVDLMKGEANANKN